MPRRRCPRHRGIGRVDLECFLVEEIIDARAASGQGAGVIALEAASLGEPDREVVVDHLGRCSVFSVK